LTWRPGAPFLLLLSAACSTHRGPPSDPGGPSSDSARALLRRAVEVARDGRAEGQRAALALVLDAVQLAGARGPANLQGTALVSAAQLYNNLGRPDSARPLLERALKQLRPGKQAATAPGTLVVLGETIQYLGQPDTALTFYRQALPAVRLTRARDEARVLNDIGSAFHQLGVLDSARFYLERARHIREREADTTGLATTLNNLGRVQQTVGRPDSAAALFVAAIPLRRAAGDLAGLGTSLNNLGYSLELLGRPADALARYREALQTLQDGGNLSTAGLVRINMARAYLALGRLDSARASVLEGLVIKRQVGDSTGVTWGLVDLGRIERARGDHPAARKALEDARTLLRASGDRGREGGALYELGSLARAGSRAESRRSGGAVRHRRGDSRRRRHQRAGRPGSGELRRTRRRVVRGMVAGVARPGGLVAGAGRPGIAGGRRTRAGPRVVRSHAGAAGVGRGRNRPHPGGRRSGGGASADGQRCDAGVSGWSRHARGLGDRALRGGNRSPIRYRPRPAGGRRESVSAESLGRDRL
jgi:tetratricopeptide (TPR) repeat protein